MTVAEHSVTRTNESVGYLLCMKKKAVVVCEQRKGANKRNNNSYWLLNMPVKTTKKP